MHPTIPRALAYWVHDWDPFLVQFTETIGIRYYGLAYLLGFISSAWLLHRYFRAGKSLLPTANIADFMLCIILGVLIGGRLGSYLLYDGWRTFTSDPLGVFKIWQSGMASHGGFIGVVLALIWFARTRRLPFFHLGDLITSTAAAGLFFGRVANFINGELWGNTTTVPWAVIFSQTGGGPFPRHPSQIYEALLEGALLLTLAQWRFWRTGIVRTRPGRLAGEFLIAYALVRTFGEIFREPDAALILGLSRGTFYSLFLAVFGLWLILRRTVPLLIAGSDAMKSGQAR
jgi:phosphatidylglycerol:prolipoprotein diacylglycerol transferase